MNNKITTFLVSLLVCIACFDFLWLFFPEYLSRKYAITLTIPAITICYFLYAEMKNTLYLLALGAFMIADYYFFIESNFSNGVISSGIAMAIYGIIVLKQSHYISTRRLLISTVPFLALYMLPMIFFVEKIEDEIFGEVIFYSFAVGYFSFMCTMTYLSQRTVLTKKLIIAGLATALMGILFGTYLFIDRKPVYSLISNILFIFSHYKMWQYVIIKDLPKTVEKV